MYGNQGYGGARGRPRRFGQVAAPVRVGEEIEVTIEAVGEKGDGIAKKNGFVLFIPNVKEGDRVRIRITKVLRKVGFAEVVTGAPAEKPAEEAPAEAEEEAEKPEYAKKEEAEAPSAEDTESFGEEPPEDAESLDEEEGK